MYDSGSVATRSLRWALLLHTLNLRLEVADVGIVVTSELNGSLGWKARAWNLSIAVWLSYSERRRRRRRGNEEKCWKMNQVFNFIVGSI